MKPPGNFPGEFLNYLGLYKLKFSVMENPPKFIWPREWVYLSRPQRKGIKGAQGKI